MANSLTSEQVSIATGLALEGVPLCAMSRAFGTTTQNIREVLDAAIGNGSIVEIPPYDWPPGTSRIRRLPSFLTKRDPEDFLMAIRDLFKLTSLEANFVRVLVTNNRADKIKLHAVAQQLRALRASKPDNYDDTDPKMVDVVICHLRRKLGKAGITIRTLWGSGYFLEEEQRKLIFAAVDKFFNDGATPANDNNPPSSDQSTGGAVDECGPGLAA